MSNTKDWTKPDENGEIDVPDELMPLFNQIGTQIRFHTISGKNEVLTVAHCVRNAQKFFQARISELEADNKRLEIKVLDMQDDRSKLREAEHFIDLQKLTLRDLEAENKRLTEIEECQKCTIFNERDKNAHLHNDIETLKAENKRLREEIEAQQVEIVKKDEQLDNHRWIPVTERLPETSMWVLCICSEERHWLAFRALNGWYIDTSFGQKFIGDQDETKHIKIQHWQPLTFPQPPKEQ